MPGVDTGGGEALAIEGVASRALCAFVHVARAVGVLVRAFKSPPGCHCATATAVALHRHYINLRIERDILQAKAGFAAAAGGEGH